MTDDGESYNTVDTAPLQLGGGGSGWEVHWPSLGVIIISKQLHVGNSNSVIT